MAIARDASAAAFGNPGDTSLSFSHTCTGLNLILFVEAGWLGTSVSVAYNSVAMTQVGGYVTLSSNKAASLWYLSNPSTGTHSVSMSGTQAGGFRPQGSSASYTGVDQTSPINTNIDKGTPASSQTASVTTTLPGCWAIFGVSDSGSASAGTHATALVNNGDHTWMFDNSGFGAITPAGAFSMTVSDSGSMVGNMAVFAPVQATNSGSFFML